MYVISADKNPCNSDPCKNGGICEVSRHTFTCTCTPSFTGPICEGMFFLTNLQLPDSSKIYFKKYNEHHYIDVHFSDPVISTVPSFVIPLCIRCIKKCFNHVI